MIDWRSPQLGAGVRLYVVLCLAAVARPVRAARTSQTAAPEPQLSRRVTLRLQGVPLSDLCQVASGQTGVGHEVADNAAGDLKTSVCGTLTLGELHQALTEVLGVSWKWTRTGKDSRYVAALTPARAAEEDRLLGERDREFAAALAALIPASNLPEEEAARLPPQLRRVLDIPVARQAIQMVGTLPSSYRSQVLAGLPILVPVAALPADTQRSLVAMADAYNRQTEEEGQAGLRALRSASPLDLLDRSGWQIAVSVHLKFASGDEEPLNIHLFNRAGSATDVFVPIGGTPSTGSAAAWRQASAVTADSAETLPPAAGWMSGTGPRWRDVVERLEAGLHHPIVSDAFAADSFLPDPRPPTPRTGEGLTDYLDAVCRHWRLRWGRAGRVITFQHLNWPSLHRAQVPESRLRRWTDHIVADRRLRLADAIEMAALSPYQIGGLSDFLPNLAERIYGNQDLLLLWKGLPPPQRRAAAQGELALRDVPLTLHDRARRLVITALGSEAPLALSNAALQIEHSPDSFVLGVRSLGMAPGGRTLDLTCSPALVEALKRERQARADALRAAAKPGQPDAQGGG